MSELEILALTILASVSLALLLPRIIRGIFWVYDRIQDQRA